MPRKSIVIKDSRYLRIKKLAKLSGKDNSSSRGKKKISKRRKFATRGVTRCNLCGRSKSVIRYFGLCRICIVEQSRFGRIPGVRKVS